MFWFILVTFITIYKGDGPVYFGVDIFLSPTPTSPRHIDRVMIILRVGGLLQYLPFYCSTKN